MAIKESALAAITSITQSDLVRAVTAAGASRRITVANLAKAIVENYTGSSLAGSAQSVKSALDSLNSKIKIVSKTITVPSGSSSSPSMVDIDFSGDVTSGAIYGLFASAGTTPLPYVNNNGQVQTWIRSVGAKTARIYEIGTGYSSRDWYFILFIN